MSAEYYDFPEGHTPRKGRLVASGILLALMGCGFGLLAAVYLVLIPAITTRFPTPAPPPTPPGSPASAPVPTPEMTLDGMSGIMQMAGGMFGVLALVFLVCGFGSMFLKRWSRPLALYLSVIWLYLGLFYLIWTLVGAGATRRMFDEEMARAGALGGPGDAAFGVMIAVGVVFIFIFGILLPGLILWLNWHADVKATLAFCDPKPRWTDRCPVPVLGICFGALSLAFGLTTMYYFSMMPWFGTVLSGTPAVIAISTTLALLIAGAWGVYRLKIAGWAICLVVPLVFFAASLTTDQNEFYRQTYEKMGMPREMVEQSMRTLENFTSTGMMVGGALTFLLPVVAYLIWALRFFTQKQPADSAA